jgi:hypothetical protein
VTDDPAEDNRTRAHWALTAVEAFASETGQADALNGTLNVPAEILLEIGGDLIADLYHLARLNEVDPADIEHQGRAHFETEVDEERAAEGIEEWEEGPDAFRSQPTEAHHS